MRKMEASGFSELSITTYQSTRYHISEDLKSRKSDTFIYGIKISV